MASIYKRRFKDKKGFSWRAVVRIKGYPAVCDHFDRKEEAEDWAADVESQIKQGKFNFDRHKHQHTYKELIDRYTQDGALEHHRSAKDTLRHLAYWKERLGAYGLVYLTADRIGKERLLLSESPSMVGKPRSTATINRYMASLSATLTYAARHLRWMSENPCLHLKKLKENPGRDRILTEEEIGRLLLTCRQSRSLYLYCIVIISLTTGARQGEILNLEWQHVDFERGRAYLKETKNGRPRSVCLAPPVIDELKKIYANRQAHKPYVFASKTTFGIVDIKKAWKKALERAEIQDCRAHDMRHTFATWSATQGASNLQLATAMGHRTLEMLQRYTHMDSEVAAQFSHHIANQITKEGNDIDNSRQCLQEA